MPFDASVRAYLRAYQNEYRAALHGGQHTAELSFRVPMHEMFRRIAHDLNPAGTFDIILEPRNQGRMGRPDWRIQDRISLGVYGYIEAKGPSNEPFDTTPYRDQINRYLTLGHKLIITDGIDFVFCFTETPVVVSIIDKARMDALDWSRLPVDPLFRFYMEQFFSNPAPQRVDEEKLVELVAIRTRNLADEIRGYSDLTIEEAMNEDEHHIIELLNGLRELVYNHNDPQLRTGRVFADFTAQVIMFCLLFAHRVICSSEDTPTQKAEKIRSYAYNDVADGEALLPFRNLMVYLRDHAGDGMFIGQWVDECIAFLSFVQMTDQQLQNPDYHRLFELFFNKFDKQARFDYGAFYTPKLLAEFVVRFVGKVVADHFDGATIYDDGNTIIDPCCGTGSFLEQIVAHDEGDGAYNLCGFEILPAPYMLANYRMSLVEQHYRKQNLHPSIILANTLSNYLLNDDANDHKCNRAGNAGEESTKRRQRNTKPAENHYDDAGNRSSNSSLSRAFFPQQTAEERNKAGGSEEGIECVKYIQDATSVQRQCNANNQKSNVQAKRYFGKLLFRILFLHRANQDISSKNSRYYDKDAVDRTHDSSENGGDDDRADNCGQLIHNDGKESRVTNGTIDRVAVRANKSRHQCKRDHDKEREELSKLCSLCVLSGADTSKNILVGSHTENNRQSHSKKACGCHAAEVQRARRCRTGCLSRLDSTDGIITEENTDSQKKSEGNNGSLYHAGCISAPKAGKLRIDEHNYGDGDYAGNAGHTKRFEESFSGHELTGKQANRRNCCTDVVDHAGDFAMIPFASIVCKGIIVMLIDKIAEEHRHKSRYSTGEAIGRASKSRGRATTCAANDKTVTNISSDCTSHQEKDTAGSTHGKIPVKGGRIAAAIPPDAEHRYKINRNNNDDRSQHSDFLSFLHHAEAQ